MGVLRGADMGGSLLRLMAAVYTPATLAAAAWPDVVRKDFTGASHAGDQGLHHRLDC